LEATGSGNRVPLLPAARAPLGRGALGQAAAPATAAPVAQPMALPAAAAAAAAGFPELHQEAPLP